MKAMQITSKPPMPPAEKAAADSSIGHGRRGNRWKSHAVRRAGEGGAVVRTYDEQAKILSGKIKNGLTMLYKYCSMATARKIFRDGTVLLNAAADFNDPFEMNCRIHWPDDKELRRRIDAQFSNDSEFYRNKIYQDALIHKRKSGCRLPAQTRQILMEDAGVSCFSETPDDILMWSHYANEHKGICIGFSALDFLQSLNTKPMGALTRSIPCKVQYQDDLPIWDAGQRRVGDVIATKASCWAYEQEWRIFSLYTAGKKQEFLPRTFQQIIFGARVEDDKAQVICSIVKRYPAIKFLKAEVSQEEYKLEFRHYEHSRE